MQFNSMHIKKRNSYKLFNHKHYGTTPDYQSVSSNSVLKDAISQLKLPIIWFGFPELSADVENGNR